LTRKLRNGQACLGVGLVNGLLYIYAVGTRVLYRLPVLLPFFSQLFTIFAITAFVATGSVFSLKRNVALSFWPLIATLLLQLILLYQVFMSMTGLPTGEFRWT
jgi:hypothetical protein